MGGAEQNCGNGGAWQAAQPALLRNSSKPRTASSPTAFLSPFSYLSQGASPLRSVRTKEASAWTMFAGVAFSLKMVRNCTA